MTAQVNRRTLLGGAAAAAGLGALRVRSVTAAPTMQTAPTAAGPGGPPTILSTDLNHPGGDPDDFFDLACGHGLGLDVRLVVLDTHTSSGGGGGGWIPATQMNHMTGQHWLTRGGISTPLRTMQDRSDGMNWVDARDQILQTLRDATEPVTIVIIGSSRDIAAAYNVDPTLFHNKVGRLLIFAGDGSAPGFVENNVALDPYAYLRLMGSGLPIRWVPCFDGGPWQAGTRSSFVQTEQRNVLPLDLPRALLRYFTYRLSANADPSFLEYLKHPLTAMDLALLHPPPPHHLRNLWVGGLLGAVCGGGSVTHQGVTVGVFEPAAVRLGLSGALDPSGPFEARVDRWRVLDGPRWRQAMIDQTVDAMRALPIIEEFR